MLPYCLKSVADMPYCSTPNDAALRFFRAGTLALLSPSLRCSETSVSSSSVASCSLQQREYPESRATSAASSWRPQALSTLCLLPARTLRLLTIVDLLLLDGSFCLLSLSHSAADGGHCIIFVVGHNRRRDIHKLPCLLRRRKVCRQSVVGAWQDVVKNHSRGTCFSSHNQPTCWYWLDAVAHHFTSKTTVTWRNSV